MDDEAPPVQSEQQPVPTQWAGGAPSHPVPARFTCECCGKVKPGEQGAHVFDGRHRLLSICHQCFADVVRLGCDVIKRRRRRRGPDAGT